MSARRAEPWAEPIDLDASALVKLLVPEPESDALNQALLGAEDVVLSRPAGATCVEVCFTASVRGG